MMSKNALYYPTQGLFHSGIKGMKWGIRRYQNEDGTLTDAGKAHYAKVDRALKEGKDGKPSKAEKIANKSQDIISNAEKINNNIGNNKRQQSVRKEASQMSDAELEQAIRRMQKEKRYADLKASETSTGKASVAQTLAVAGGVVGIASGVVGIAATIYQIQKDMKSGD